ncbi:MAG: FAD-binding oxidoreductase [Chloroflexi bacterium]|nr:FAD-binding oxidoreductase [Chloroflexota bacterium]
MASVAQLKLVGDALPEVVGVEALVPRQELPRYTLDSRVAPAAVRPGSIEEVSRVLSLASRLGAAVVPWGGGTRMALGNPPLRYDLALDLRRLNRIVEHQPQDLTVTVEAGVTLDMLQHHLAQQGQTLPLDPPFPSAATIGGTLAANASGPLRAGFGLPRDLVLGMKVVHADGTVSSGGGRVVKNVTGYDMPRLFIGSLGTLAVIVEVTLKVAPLPPAERTVVAAFPNSEGAGRAALALMGSGFSARAVELLDGLAWGSVSGTVKGLPRRDRTVYWLAVCLGGRPRAVERMEQGVAELCFRERAAEVEVVPEAEGKPLWRALADLGWEPSGLRLSLRACVLPSLLVGALQEVKEAGAKLGHGPAVAAHATHGVLRAFWYGEARTTWPAPWALPVIETLRERLQEMEGDLTVEKVPPEVRGQVDTWGDLGAALPIMRHLKARFDPRGILNSGRFARGV